MSEESDSSSGGEVSCSSSNYIFYSERPEWKDIKPIPQDDGSNPVVSIAYSDKCKLNCL